MPPTKPGAQARGCCGKGDFSTREANGKALDRQPGDLLVYVEEC